MNKDIKKFIDSSDFDKSYILISENATLVKGGLIEIFALLGKMLSHLKDNMHESDFNQFYKILGLILEGKD